MLLLLLEPVAAAYTMPAGCTLDAVMECVKLGSALLDGGEIKEDRDSPMGQRWRVAEEVPVCGRGHAPQLPAEPDPETSLTSCMLPAISLSSQGVCWTTVQPAWCCCCT